MDTEQRLREVLNRISIGKEDNPAEAAWEVLRATSAESQPQRLNNPAYAKVLCKMIDEIADLRGESIFLVLADYGLQIDLVPKEEVQ
jgi:hypothetical protein